MSSKQLKRQAHDCFIEVYNSGHLLWNACSFYKSHKTKPFTFTKIVFLFLDDKNRLNVFIKTAQNAQNYSGRKDFPFPPSLVECKAAADDFYSNLYYRQVFLYKESTDGKINKYILCFWSRSRVSPGHTEEGGGQTMLICSDRYWSRWGWNWAVQSTTAGLQRPQQRRWKNDARFWTTPMLQTDGSERESIRQRNGELFL